MRRPFLVARSASITSPRRLLADPREEVEAVASRGGENVGILDRLVHRFDEVGHVRTSSTKPGPTPSRLADVIGLCVPTWSRGELPPARGQLTNHSLFRLVEQSFRPTQPNIRRYARFVNRREAVDLLLGTA